MTTPPSPDLAREGLSFVGKVPYKWAGANPSGWDCSGMWNWIIGHVFHMTLPLGITNFNGMTHGPVVLNYATWKSAVTVPTPEVGDLCLWVGVGASAHMGCCTVAGKSGRMVSALNPSMGTAETPIQGTGPAGAPLIFRRVTGVKGSFPPGLGCAPQVGGAVAMIGGIAWLARRK